jgi:hypothetical protein
MGGPQSTYGRSGIEKDIAKRRYVEGNELQISEE